MEPTPPDAQTAILRALALYEMLRAEWPVLKGTMPWDAPGDTPWTFWILGYFFDKGKALDFKVETKTLPGRGGTGQYLVDLCWWTEQRGEYWLELALESEWQPGKGEIEHDFYKLIDVKSRLKVWVCSCGEKLMQARQSELPKEVSKARFKLPSEEYLIINLPYSERPEYKDCVAVEGFWMDYLGNPSPLQPFRIYRRDRNEAWQDPVKS